MKATAVAPANIAFIKYWGNKKDNLPYSDTISMNISGCVTTTTVEWNPQLKHDFAVLNKKTLRGADLERVINHLRRVRKILQVRYKAKVVSENSFPTGVGIASSASGFAALTLAAVKAAGGSLSEKELTLLARQGSGSAVRSIPSGFVIWHKGTNTNNSYAESLYPPDWWSLSDIVLIVTTKEKSISSVEGHKRAPSSPLFETRVKRKLPERLRKVKRALAQRDIKLLGETIEEEARELHEVARTSKPPINYLIPTTKKIINQAIPRWRREGVPVYFTLDAGPSVHIICLAEYERALLKKIKKEFLDMQYIVNKPSEGARVIRKHLF